VQFTSHILIHTLIIGFHLNTLLDERHAFIY
jgi:hypothetical protein